MGCITSKPIAPPSSSSHRRSASVSDDLSMTYASRGFRGMEDPRPFHPPPVSQTVRYKRHSHHRRALTDMGPTVICNLEIITHGGKCSLPIECSLPSPHHSLPIPNLVTKRGEHVPPRNIPSRDRSTTESYAFEWQQYMNRQMRMNHLQRQAARKSDKWRRRSRDDYNHHETTPTKRSVSNIV